MLNNNIQPTEKGCKLIKHNIRREIKNMSRSSKKMPYVAPELLKRIEAMNESGEKTVLKTWSRAS